MTDTATTTIAAHLTRRLNELGVDQAFGIVGDFALRLFGALHDEGLPVLVTCDEQGAGFAADAYARLRGLGVVAVTYGVGGLKVANATAGAWAEYVPMLVLSGAPGMVERRDDPLLHHKVKGFDTQLKVFEDLTVAQAVLSDPATAAAEVDRVLTAMLEANRPGYIEVPRDMVGVPIEAVEGDLAPRRPPVDSARLAAAVDDAARMMRAAGSVVALAGEMAWRRGLEESVRALAEDNGIPIATTSLARGLFPERHPLSLGVFMGAVSPEETIAVAERADVVLALGVLYTDLTMGAFTANPDVERLIVCKDADVTVGFRTYRNVPLWAFLPALVDALRADPLGLPAPATDGSEPFAPNADVPLTVEAVMACVGAVIDDRHGLLVEPGECLFASVELRAPTWALSSAYYATMGYAVPAAIGAGVADPARRPVVLVGDGSFLMTGIEVAAAAFHGLAPIVLVLDNDGYGTQRPMLDGPFNDIPALRAERMPELIGTGVGVLCRTEGELFDALTDAVAGDDTTVVRAVVPRGRVSSALKRLTDTLGRRV